MKMRSKIVSGLLLMFFAFNVGGVSAGPTLGELYSSCSSTDLTLSTACRFYILGAVDGIDAGNGAHIDRKQTLATGKNTMFCLPDGTTQTQIVDSLKDLMKEFVEKYPDDQPNLAKFWILVAINNRFPCAQRR